MTTSGTSTFELNVDALIRRSFQLAGLLEAAQSPSQFPDDLAMARDFLNMELGAMQTEGLLQRTVERKTLALSAGTTQYALESDCIDVFIGPDNMIGTMLAPGSTTETLVRAIHRHEYVSISSKSSQGTPVFCYVERLAAVSVLFWPVPSQAFTFSYQKVRAVMDTTPGDKTPDVWVRRQQALMWSLAFTLATAKSQPLPRCGFLRAERDRLKDAAKMNDNEQGHGQLFVAHMV